MPPDSTPAASEISAVSDDLLADGHAATLETPDAWQALEALRLGVVPAVGVRAYTVAREKELARVQEIYDAGHGARVIWGDYGTGKTHLLDVVEQSALEQGYVTVRLTLDMVEHPLHQPARLYRFIAGSMRHGASAQRGFESVFEQLLESEAHYDPAGARASRFFSPYLHAMRVGDDEAVGWLRDYVRGDPTGSEEVNQVLRKLRWQGQGVLTMSDYRTYGRMYIHLLGNLAAWCKDAGQRGLVLLFDEVERVDALRRRDRECAMEVVKHVAAVTMRDDTLAFPPEGLYKGGHSVHRKLPLRFHEDQPLCAVFAMTPLEDIQQDFATVTESTEYDVHLPALTQKIVPDLVRRIAGIQQVAHPGFVPSAEAVERVAQQVSEHVAGGGDAFRAAVRATVFLLDAQRMPSTDDAW